MSVEQGGRYDMGPRGERSLMRAGVIVLIAILLLGFGAMSIQQTAWTQGYLTGLVAGGAGGDGIAHYALYNSRGGFPGLGLFWLLGLGFLFFMIAGKFMRMRAWHMAGGPQNEAWREQWRQCGPAWQRPHEESRSRPEQPTEPVDGPTSE